MFDWLLDGLSWLWDKISNWLIDALSSLIGWILYLICSVMCRLVGVVYQMFAVLAGLETVTYTETLASGVAVKNDYLINIFFSHSTINSLYWGMVLIGMVMAFFFTMWAVIRKAADLNGEQKAGMGQILGSLGKSFVLMLCMNLIISFTLTATNVLLQSISTLFDNPYTATQASKKTFSGDDFKTMNEIYQTIGAYSLNGAYNSRYNLNSCFNAIRPQLAHLQENGMFDVYYTTQQVVVNNGVEELKQLNTWQSVLQRIVRSASLEQDVMMDVYHEELSQALLEAMDILRYEHSGFKPLESYSSNYLGTSAKPVSFDVVIFLSGTAEAANNAQYNITGSINDPVRGPYYTGTRSIYNYSQVKEDFNTRLGGINYLLIIFLTVVIFKELIRIMLACVVRMFQMLLLYITVPTFLAVMPLDGGEKFKQWSQAFVIQNFSIFGTVITMRLMMVFVPIVFSADLVLFDSFFMNTLCKVFILYGGFVAVGRSSGLITGILANNAGWQAIQAGDVRSEAEHMMQRTGLDRLGSAPAEAVSVAADASGLTTLAGKLSAPFNSDSELRRGWREQGGRGRYQEELSRRQESERRQERASGGYASSDLDSNLGSSGHGGDTGAGPGNLGGSPGGGGDTGGRTGDALSGNLGGSAQTQGGANAGPSREPPPLRRGADGDRP